MAPTATIIVTGGAGGIGSEFVRHFLNTHQSSSYHGIYLVHPSESTVKLRNLLLHHQSLSNLKHSHEIQPLDLSRLHDIHAFTSSIGKRIASGSLPRIHLLLLIAGGFFRSTTAPNGVDYTTDKYEKSFAVNFLANALITQNLHRNFEREGTRVIFMASTTHDPTFLSNTAAYTAADRAHGVYSGPLQSFAEGRQDRTGRRSDFDAAAARYGTSKLLLIMWMYAFHRRVSSPFDPPLSHRQSRSSVAHHQPPSNISVIAMDPAAVGGTGLTRSFPWPLFMVLQYLLLPLAHIWTFLFPNGRFRTASKAGSDLVFACFDREMLEFGKTVYLNGTAVADSSPESHDVAKQERLWEETGRMLDGLTDEV